jgi:hypothetical protein
MKGLPALLIQIIPIKKGRHFYEMTALAFKNYFWNGFNP